MADHVLMICTEKLSVDKAEADRAEIDKAVADNMCCGCSHVQYMGGAALLLALSDVIMSAQLPVRLRLLVPAVENSISRNAYRPMDVLQTRAGLTVEVRGMA